MSKEFVLVEDEKLWIEIFSDIAKREGYELRAVLTTPDKAASDLENELEKGNPKMIVCDGLSGKYQEVQRISQARNVKFVLFTADDYRVRSTRKDGGIAFDKVNGDELFKYLKENLEN